MLLKGLKLHNFRGYKDITISINNDLSVLIGRNDVGKSTILEALEIFFNSEQVKLDQDDLYVLHDNNDETISISCMFLVEEDELIIDSTVKTDLEAEYLYNEDGLLEICMQSDGGKKARFFINAFYPSELETPLVQLKIADLKKELSKRRELVPQYESVNKSVSSEIRRAIYATLKNPENRRLTLIDLTKEDAKNLYAAIQKELPIFFLFKADRENKDGDPEVQNPLKMATRNVLKGIEGELERIKRTIEEEVKKIGEETIEKMKELDPNLADSLTTSVNTKAWDSIFSFQLIDEHNIPLNKRGSGVRRLLLLSYLRAEAERRARENANTNIIYAIEEPETAQHPNYQRLLMEALIELSENPLHQIIITTHTPEIAKMASLEQIVFIKKVNGVPTIIMDTNNKLRDVKRTLGVHESIDGKVVVCVEGENDVSFLKNIGKIPEFQKIIDLSSDEVSIIPMHGGTLKNWIERDYLRKSNVREIHIYDSDVKAYRKAIDEMNAKNDGRRHGYITRRYEMENYIPRMLVEEQFKIDLSKYEAEWNTTLDIPKTLVGKVDKRLGRDDEEREMRIKRILNGTVMKKCTFEMIESMGNSKELQSWFVAIREAIN